MKKLLHVPFLLVLMFIFSSFSRVNSPGKTSEINYENNPNEIIVAFEKLSSKDLLELDEAIAQIPGVKNFGYCQKKNLYFFTYDENRYRTEEAAMDAITIHTKEFHPLLKVGTSSEQISKTCNN